MITNGKPKSALPAAVGLIFIIACVGLALFAQAAELEVVADQGGEDASPYFRSLQADPPQPSAQARPHASVGEADMLPVESRRILPGKVERRRLNVPGLRPFFMVGDDELSIEWLSARAEALSAIGAVGMAVNVPTAQALARIRAAAPGLRILPTAGDDVAGRLRIEHYPVLITATSIEQ